MVCSCQDGLDGQSTLSLGIVGKATLVSSVIKLSATLRKHPSLHVNNTY